MQASTHNEQLHSFFLEADIGLALFGAQGDPQACNASFLRLAGLKESDFLAGRLESMPGLDTALVARLQTAPVIKTEHYLERSGQGGQGADPPAAQPGFFAELTLHRLASQDGAGSGCALMLRDISVRRQAEHQLLMLSHAIDQTTNSIVITDTNGRIRFVNSAFCKTSGYASEEIIGKTPRLLKSGLMPAEIYKRMWQKLAKGEVWQGELLNRRKSGDLYWENVSITPIKDPRGLIYQHIAVKEDITERKLNKGRTELLHAVTRILSSEQNFAMAAPSLAKAITQALSCGWVELWEQDASTGHLVCRAYASPMEKEPGSGEPPRPGQVLASPSDPRLQTLRSLGEQRFTLAGLHAAHSFAIRSIHRNEGVLVVGDLVRDDGSLSALLQGLCAQVGEFSQRLRENSELRLLAFVAQSIPGKVLLAESDGRILWANTEVEAYTGRVQAELRRLRVEGLPGGALQKAEKASLVLSDGKQLSLAFEAEIRPLRSGAGAGGRVLVLAG